MPEGKGKHLDIDDRDIVEEGLGECLSAGKIARRLKVSASTVTREVKANRTIKVPERKGAVPASRCIHYRDCQDSASACAKCQSKLTTCKKCRTRRCIDSCPRFELLMCEKTEKWPYVCPKSCAKRGACSLPKCSYRAKEADKAYRARLASARSGVDISPEELAAMVELVGGLLGKGQSIEAIWHNHRDELPVCERTFYNYVHQGVMGLSNMQLPRQVRYKPRKKGKEPGRDRVDRTGRTYADFKALPVKDQVRVVQADSVVGLVHNVQSILTLHLLRHSFQLYLLQASLAAEHTVAAFDAIETYLGSPEAFEAILGIILADRGSEFDDWEGMERSCLEKGKRRCKVFYCDAMNTNQKSPCEKNHEELRKILPKGRSDFDALSFADVALACSHVNSYPRPSRQGATPYDLAAPELPAALLDALGVVRVPADDVTMKPTLLPHAVIL